MSYIQHREKVFHTKRRLPFSSIFKAKFPGRLKNVNSVTDHRSWSLDPMLRKNFFLDHLRSSETSFVLSTSSSEMTVTSPPSSPKTPESNRPTSAVRAVPSRLLNRKVKSDENMVKNKRKPQDFEKILEEANEKIKKLIYEKDKLNRASQEYIIEIDNLRNLVVNVQKELSFIDEIKAENTMLKSKLSLDVHKEIAEAQDEINYLSSQIEIYKDYKKKYDVVKSDNQRLKEERDQMNLMLKEMKWNNDQLFNEIESLKIRVATYESRDLAVSNAIVDKEVLRERLQIKDEKISCLVGFLEEQDMTIQDLMHQLQRITANLTFKEGAVGKQINSLKYSLFEKSNRINELEDKLHASDLLIREMEKLRDHFRLSNCALSENMQNYKKQFNVVVSCSKKLLAKINVYKEEVHQKSLQIQKLSIMPSSAASVIHLAQLLNILRSTEELSKIDERGAASFIPVMKRIVEQLKGELLGGRIEYPSLEVYNINTQTEFFGVDECLQNELYFVEDKFVEVYLPDQYFYDYQKSQTKIEQLNKVIETLEESFFRVDSTNHSLQNKIICSIEDKSAKEREISSLQSQLQIAEESLIKLRSEMDHNDTLLQKSLCEIELERGVRESTSEILVATLDKTTYEYNTYIKVLESLLKYKEEKIQFLEDYLCKDDFVTDTPDNDYIALLENEIKTLSEKYINEKQNVRDLNIQNTKLQAALSEKMDHFKIVQEKLLRAEKIFEHLNNIENQCMYKYDSHRGDRTVTSTEIVVEPSNNTSTQSEKYNSQLEEEKSIKCKQLQESVSKEYVLNLMQRNNLKKRNLKKTINQLKCNICRIKSILFQIRRKLKLTEKINHDYSIRLSQMDTYSADLKKDNDSLKEKLQNESVKSSELELTLKMKSLEFCELRDKKRKIENILINIIKEYDRNIAKMTQKKQSKAVNTEGDIPIKDRESEVNTLQMEIMDLRLKHDSSIKVITALEERLANIPQKENDSSLSSVEVQTNLLNEKDIKSHYESVIESLQKESSMKIEESEKQQMDNLNKIREAYEKDKNNLRKSQEKKLQKLQAMHQKEIEDLKLSYQENCKKYINKSEIEENHLKDLENQKIHYESLLKNKESEETELNKEIKELKQEVENIIQQRKKDDDIFNDKIKEQLLAVKKKFKKHYKKLKQSHKDELLELSNKNRARIEELNDEINKYMMRKDNESLNAECQTLSIVDDLESVGNISVPPKEISMSKERMDQNKTDGVCNKKIDINFRERIQYSIKEANGLIPKEILGILNRFTSSGLSIFNSTPAFCVNGSINSSTNTPRLPEIYYSMIENADKMGADFQEILKHISIYKECEAEGKVLNQEIKDLLKKERINSYIIEQKLNFEYKRAEKLKAQKNEYHRQVLELKKQLINVESDLHLERDKYENLKKSFESVIIQRKTSEQLGMSLERLKTKLQNAVQCEKRLCEEFEEERKASERIQIVIETNRIAEGKDLISAHKNQEINRELASEDTALEQCIKNENGEEEISSEMNESPQIHAEIQQEQTMNKVDLKVIFIERCGIFNRWKDHLPLT